MAVVVSVAMILGSYLVYNKQVETMIDLAIDSGGSLAQFIAIQSVEALLIEDWVALESFVHEVEQRQQISYLRISDHQRVIRASTDPAELGQPLIKTAAKAILRQGDDLVIRERDLAEQEVFDFQVPLLFQDKRIGSLELGISRDALNSASSLTFYTMLLLLFAVVLTVAIVAYLLASSISLPIRRLRSALEQVLHGNLEHRIRAERNDEFGLLFDTFNRMTETLKQNRELRERKLAKKLMRKLAEANQTPTSEDIMEEEVVPEAQSQEPPSQEPQAQEPELEFEPPPPDSLDDDATRILQPKVVRQDST
jgi:serine/threonine-protein kinase